MRSISLAVTLMFATACKKPEPPPAPPAKTEAKSFECTRRSELHTWNEPGFAWPDARFALAAARGGEADIRAGDNEDVLALEDRVFFIRGWAPIPVQGRERFGIGFWVQVSRGTFDEFKQRKRLDPATATGRIANQSMYLAPTLGARVKLEAGPAGARPIIRFTDEQHPMTNAQQQGVSNQVAREWLSEVVHQGEPAERSAPIKGTLATHGWEVIDPALAGKKSIGLDAHPKQGDTVKLVVRFAAADENGESVPLTAGWWVQLDDLTQAELWSGTLRNDVRLPATLQFGSRLWFKPTDIIEVGAAQ